MRSFCLIAALVLSVAGAVAQQKAELIIIRGNIRVMDAADRRASAIAISAGRILEVGTDSEMLRFAGDGTRIIDAGGKLVIPGFNDAHVHLTGIGNRFSHLDISAARTPDDVISSVRFYSRVLPKGRWLLGRGVEISRTAPDAPILDAASPQNPVLIYTNDYRSAIINSAAARLAGIEAPRGPITGNVLLRVRRSVPPGHEKNWPEIVATASNFAASLGVTSIQDVHSDDLSGTLLKLESEGRLKTRVYECLAIGDRKRASELAHATLGISKMVHFGCVKGMSFGGPEEVTELNDAVADADRMGLQVLIHAIGESSNSNVIGAFANVVYRSARPGRRFRVEHAHRMKAVDRQRLAKLPVIASMQPNLFFRNGDAGDDYRAFKRLGIRLAFGSDASLSDLDPLLGIYAAVTTSSGPLTVFEAVRAYTFGSAYAEFEEASKGTLEPGRAADLVILSDDIFSIPAASITRTRVITTIVAGRIVYTAQ